MKELVTDTSKFVKVEFNKKHKVNQELRHVLDLEGNIKTCLANFLEKQYISREDYNFLKPCGSRPGIMYGLCKVHKGRGASNDILPFRPILSAIGTCTYNIAKFFVPILKDFTLNEYTVRDSFSFCDEIQEQNNNLYMASFDIESLFKNIPLDETINICVNNVFGNKKIIKGLLKKDFKQLLTLSVKSSCFVFNYVYYQQVDGVAIGSPIGPTLANLFLINYESKWLKDCPVQFALKYYRRYVNDIFLLFKAMDHVQKFFRYMNSRHPKIKFTFKEENDNKISFLGILITRTENKFTTSIFRKKSV